jgi:hypothetical protein
MINLHHPSASGVGRPGDDGGSGGQGCVRGLVGQWINGEASSVSGV